MGGRKMPCPRCQWRYRDIDIFCGCCGYRLASIAFKLDQMSQGLSIFPGFPLRLEIENIGVMPVEITDIYSESLILGDEITPLPLTINVGETVAISRAHKALVNHAGRLTLTTSAGLFDVFTRCKEAPLVLLKTLNLAEYDYNTPDPQVCSMDVGRPQTFTLETDLLLELESEVYLVSSNEQLKLQRLPSLLGGSIQFLPGNTFTFDLVCSGDLPKEGVPVKIIFPFRGFGNFEFSILLRYSRRPLIEIAVDPSILNRVYVSGSKGSVKFPVVVKYVRGEAPVRIQSVDMDQDWLRVDELEKINGSVLNPLNDEGNKTENQELLQIEIMCELNKNLLPHTQNQIVLSNELLLKLQMVGSDEFHHYSRKIPITVVPPHKLALPIAVDFGTTNSCIGYIGQDNSGSGNEQSNVQLCNLDPKSDAKNNDTIPTAMQFLVVADSRDNLQIRQEIAPDHRKWDLDEKSVYLHFGELAKELRFKAEDISSIAWSFKRFLNEPEYVFTYQDRGTGDVQVNGFPYPFGNNFVNLTPIKLVGLYIRYLLERFQEETGYVPQEAIFTFPAVFNQQKDALSKAIQFATLDMELEIILKISEPEAIALHYAETEKLQKELKADHEIVFGVFDCGGGTTDISIVRLKELAFGSNEIEILASDGENSLGGDLISFRIAQFIYESIIPAEYQNKFPFPKALDTGFRTADPIEKGIFSQFFALAEYLKENSTKTIIGSGNVVMSIQPALEPQAFSLISRGEVGILDLIRDGDIDVFWPDLQVVGRDDIVIEVFDGNSRRINGSDIPEELDPIDYEQLCLTVRSELERGFERLSQMQQLLFDRKLISGYVLDYLILDGNSSRFPLLQEMAKEKFDSKRIILETGSLKHSVVRGALIYGSHLRNPMGALEVRGISKLNYPLGFFVPGQGFVPMFDRWISLEDQTLINQVEDSPLISVSKAPDQFYVYEFFEWDFSKGIVNSSHRVAATIPVPRGDERFKNNKFWTFHLRLSCENGSGVKLLYNFKVGNLSDGSELELFWDEYQVCDGFSHT